MSLDPGNSECGTRYRDAGDGAAVTVAAPSSCLAAFVDASNDGPVAAAAAAAAAAAVASAEATATAAPPAVLLWLLPPPSLLPLPLQLFDSYLTTI